MTAQLIPPDPKRCQAEWRSGSFMTLGPRHLVRCDAEPTVIITERIPGPDGQRGSMSLCDACFEKFKSQQDSQPAIDVWRKEKR